MNTQLQAKLANLPLLPGCYLMKDCSDEIIYVGKAKKLKNRVNQYFVGAHDYKTTKLVSLICDFDFIVTNSEKEALLLEINLIKLHRPKFNIFFMDDKTYPMIRLTSEKYPVFKVVREKKMDKKSSYFGPFPDASAAHTMLKYISMLFPLRKCDKMPKKVCLYYHLKQCLGPCEYDVSEYDYQQYVDEAMKLLKGDTKQLVMTLKEQMNEYIENLDYEKAKSIHEIIQSIDHVNEQQQVQFSAKNNMDAFAYAIDRGFICLQMLGVRDGKVLEKDHTIGELVFDPLEQSGAMIASYYEHHPMPKEIVVMDDIDVDLLQEALSCKITVAKKGYKASLLQMAQSNAKKQVEMMLDIQQEHNKTISDLTSSLQAIMNHPAKRIELYDVSHIANQFTVGAQVVFDDGQMVKSDYRHYRLENGKSDVDSMREMLTRRFSKEGIIPDCVIVDGSLAQINVASDVLNMFNIDCALYGLAKNDRHQTSTLISGDGEVMAIDRTSDVFFYLTRMQDEVHRFAISYHRKLRSKSMFSSILDNIDGLGDVRKKKLLSEFKSVKRLKMATIDELMAVLPKKVAEEVYRVIKENA